MSLLHARDVGARLTANGKSGESNAEKYPGPNFHQVTKLRCTVWCGKRLSAYNYAGRRQKCWAKDNFTSKKVL